MIPHEGREIFVNGCVFCGAVERGHGLRYDHLHPTGRRTYLAPPDEIRKARLKWLRAQRSDK